MSVRHLSGAVRYSYHACPWNAVSLSVIGWHPTDTHPAPSRYMDAKTSIICAGHWPIRFRCLSDARHDACPMPKMSSVLGRCPSILSSNTRLAFHHNVVYDLVSVPPILHEFNKRRHVTCNMFINIHFFLKLPKTGICYQIQYWLVLKTKLLHVLCDAENSGPVA